MIAGTVRIRVKNCGPFRKMLSSSWGGFSAFSRYKLFFYVDGKLCDQKLMASKVPYEVDMAPGPHMLQFTRKKIGGIDVQGAMTSMITGAASLLSGGITDIFFEPAEAMSKENTKKGICYVNVTEGGCVDITVKPSWRGFPIPKEGIKGL